MTVCHSHYMFRGTRWPTADPSRGQALPRLHRRRDGGLYLRGRVSGSYAVWQVGREAERYLLGRGVSDDGGPVRVAELKHFLTHGWVTTGGGGLTDTPLPAHPPGLADRLGGWAADGGSGSLADIVCPAGGPDHRPLCFPAAFLDWLDRLPPGLAGLADVGEAEFAALARGAAEPAAGPLLDRLAATGAGAAVWQLGRLAGRVAALRRADARCPDEWRQAPLLRWLFDQVAGRSPGGARATAARRPPVLVYQPDRQQVAARLPGRRVPSAVPRACWRVGEREVHLSADGGRVAETESAPLTAADSYPVTFAHGGEQVARWRLLLPQEGPLLIAHPSGELVEADAPDPLPPGDYFGLVRPGQLEAARALAGVGFVEPVPVAPVGWPGWAGWRLTLAAAAGVPGYRVSGLPPAARLDLAPPPPAAVRWAGPDPVFLGRLPELRVTPPEVLRRAAVEVVGDPDGAAEVLAVRAGRDLPVIPRDGAGVLDLATFAELRDRHGSVAVRVRLPDRVDQPAPAVRFVRLPPIAAEEVSDPVRPTATAVRLTGARGLVAGPGTELTVAADGVLLRAANPERSPVVAARHPDGWSARISVAVTRGRREPEGDWQPLPLPDIDLSAVGPSDGLRLEFVRPPAVEDGSLVCRLDAAEVQHVGRRVGPTAFVLPLHRWRDGFAAAGRVSVRGADGWVEVATVRRDRAGLAGGDRPWWAHLAGRLDDAVTSGAAGLAAVAAEALAAAREPRAGAAGREVLVLAVGRAAVACGAVEPAAVREALAPVADRPDLPEAALLAAVLAARHGPPADEPPDRQGDLPDLPAAEAVRAERWYRYARAAAGPVPGMWRTVADRAAGGADGPAPHAWDAALLRAVAALATGMSPADGPLSGPPAHRAWLAAARAAARFLTRPWAGPPPRGRVEPLPAPPPVLLPVDACLVRAAHNLATGAEVGAIDAAELAALPAAAAVTLPLLHARLARYSGGPILAADEYARALAAFMDADRLDLIEVVAAEKV